MKRYLIILAYWLCLAFIISACRGSGNSETAAPSTSETGELFVTNYDGRISVFDAASDGDITPIREFSASTKGGSIAVDAVNNEIFVADSINNSIRVYSRTAEGNASPLRIISGEAAVLSLPCSIAVDVSNNEIFVANLESNWINVYPRTAEGNVSPLRHFWDDYPSSFKSIAIDNVNNEIFAITAGTIEVFPRAADGYSAPLRTIFLDDIARSDARSVTVDTVHDEIFVVSDWITQVASSRDAVTVYARTADGVATPLRRIIGEATSLKHPAGIAVDPMNNEIFIANEQLGSVTVYSRTTDGNTAPLRIISGTSTGLYGPSGIALITK